MVKGKAERRVLFSTKPKYFLGKDTGWVCVGGDTNTPLNEENPDVEPEAIRLTPK